MFRASVQVRFIARQQVILAESHIVSQAARKQGTKQISNHGGKPSDNMTARKLNHKAVRQQDY